MTARVSCYHVRIRVSVCLCGRVCVCVFWQSALPVSFQCFATNCCQLQLQQPEQQQQQQSRAASPALHCQAQGKVLFSSCAFSAGVGAVNAVENWINVYLHSIQGLLSASVYVYVYVSVFVFMCVSVSLTALASCISMDVCASSLCCLMGVYE